MNIRVSVLVFVLACRSAASSGTVVVSYDKAVKIAGLTIAFTEVVQDSRCPRAVDCVWAGAAEIRVVVAKGSTSESLLLSTRSPENKGHAFGRTIELVELEPYPDEPGQRDPHVYRAKLAVDPE